MQLFKKKNADVSQNDIQPPIEQPIPEPAAPAKTGSLFSKLRSRAHTEDQQIPTDESAVQTDLSFDINLSPQPELFDDFDSFDDQLIEQPQPEQDSFEALIRSY